MEHTQGMKLILKGLEKDNEDKMYLKWLHDTARFEIGFNEYKNASKPYRKSTQKEKDEILKKWGCVENGII